MSFFKSLTLNTAVYLIKKNSNIVKCYYGLIYKCNLQCVDLKWVMHTLLDNLLRVSTLKKLHMTNVHLPGSKLGLLVDHHIT